MNVIAPEAAVGDDSPARLERLADLSQQLLDRARALGASQAEVSCSEDRGLEVNVRLGEVETVQSTRDRGIAVTVYFAQLIADAFRRSKWVERALNWGFAGVFTTFAAIILTAQARHA